MNFTTECREKFLNAQLSVMEIAKRAQLARQQLDAAEAEYRAARYALGEAIAGSIDTWKERQYGHGQDQGQE